jgi:hypothetical protein
MKSKFLLIFVIGLLCFGLGYASSLFLQKPALGDQALGNFMMEFTVLKYLKNGDLKNANKILLQSIEDDLVNVSRFGTSESENLNSEKMKRLVTQFAEIRKNSIPTNYGDGGVFNNRVDLAIQQLISGEFNSKV